MDPNGVLSFIFFPLSGRIGTRIIDAAWYFIVHVTICLQVKIIGLELPFVAAPQWTDCQDRLQGARDMTPSPMKNSLCSLWKEHLVHPFQSGKFLCFASSLFFFKNSFSVSLSTAFNHDWGKLCQLEYPKKKNIANLSPKYWHVISDIKY